MIFLYTLSINVYIVWTMGIGHTIYNKIWYKFHSLAAKTL